MKRKITHYSQSKCLKKADSMVLSGTGRVYFISDYEGDPQVALV